MDAIDTTSTDIVIFDDTDETEDISFGKEVAKTLAISTATSAGVFGGFVVIALLTPKVKAWFNRKKTDAPSKEEIVEKLNQKVEDLKTEKD